MALFIPVAIGLAGSRINVAVSTVLVSFLQEGSMTWLNYAFRIMHLPLGLFGIAVGTVALPRLSGHAADNDLEGIHRTLGDSLKLVLFLTVPTSIIIAFLANPITAIIYERGRFTPADTLAVGQALVLYIIGIPFMAAVRNVAGVFYAYKDSKTPMMASFASVGLNLVLNIALMQAIGFLAFPLSTTLAAALNIALLVRALPGKIGRVDLGPILKYFGSLAAASTAGGLAGWAVYRFLFGRMDPSFGIRLAGVAAGGGAALLAFFGLARVFGVKDAAASLRRFLRR